MQRPASPPAAPLPPCRADRPVPHAARAGRGCDDADAAGAAGCGWYESSRELSLGLQVQEHGDAAALGWSPALHLTLRLQAMPAARPA